MRARAQLGLLLAVFCITGLGQSRERPWNDGRAIHEVAESIVHHGGVDVSAANRGPFTKGKWYAAHPIVPSAIHLPGVLIHGAIRKLWPLRAELVRALTTHIGPTVLMAGAGWLFFHLCLYLGLSVGGASVSVLALVLSSSLAVYARYPYSEMSQAFCFIGFFAAVLRMADYPSRRHAVAFGLWASLLVNTKVIFALSVLGPVPYLLWQAFRVHRLRALDAVKLVVWAALVALPGLVVMLAYNHAKTGSVFDIGYNLGGPPGKSEGALSASPWVGLWGLFLSPGKSIFLYSPLLFLSLLALPRLPQRWRVWALTTVFTVAPALYTYTKFPYWSGDWCWGPRYMLFAVPAFLLPACWLLEQAWRAKQRLLLAAFAGLFAIGVAVQVLGSALYWDHFIRIAQAVKIQWLGAPNRKGATIPNDGTSCDPCFEDFHAMNWLPAFQPIHGHYWIVRSVIKGDTWQAAATTAPWTRYTKLPIDLSGTWPRVRPDWWMFDFNGTDEPLAKKIFWTLALGLTVGSALWVLEFAPWAPRRRRLALPPLPTKAA